MSIPMGLVLSHRPNRISGSAVGCITPLGNLRVSNVLPADGPGEYSVRGKPPGQVFLLEPGFTIFIQ